MAIVIGMVYWQQELTTNGIRNINGALFTILLNLSFGNALSAIDVIPKIYCPISRKALKIDSFLVIPLGSPNFHERALQRDVSNGSLLFS